jgi:K+-sensing histidine kinase KdpD
MSLQSAWHDFLSSNPVEDIRPIRRVPIYLLALALPLLILAIRNGLPEVFGERLVLILFIPPIAIGAILGGIGPGMVATLTSGLCTALFLIHPIGNPSMVSGDDLLQWGALVSPTAC